MICLNDLNQYIYEIKNVNLKFSIIIIQIHSHTVLMKKQHLKRKRQDTDKNFTIKLNIVETVTPYTYGTR